MIIADTHAPHDCRRRVHSTHLRRRLVSAGTALALVTLAMATQAAIQFEEVTETARLLRSGESFGAAWGDVNGDGYPDLAVPNHRERPSLYVNRGDGTFTNHGGFVKTWVQKSKADTHGLTWMDFDNDGDQDILVGVGSGNPSQLLVNEYGELVNRTAALGLAYDKAVSVRLPVWVDYNADARADLVMVNHRGIAPVLEQTATGFQLATQAVGMACDKFHYAQLFDVNNDGRQEFLCGSMEKNSANFFPQAVYDTRYLPFRNIAAQMPAVEKALDTVIADFDNNLREDIFALRGILRPSGVSQQGRTVEALLVGGNKGFKFISNGILQVELHWNKGDESTDTPNIRIGKNGYQPASASFTLDPNNPAVEGIPTYSSADAPLVTIGFNKTSDEWSFNNISGTAFSNAYFIVRSEADVTSLRAVGLWPSDKPVASVLLSNTADGYVDKTTAANLAAPLSCISTVAGDFDNDMDIDIYAACRAGPANIANMLFENQGDGTFQPVAGAGGAAGHTGLAVTSGAGTADTVVLADYDVDGFLDLYIANGFNMRPLGSGGPEQLFRNRGNGNHWIEVDLVAEHSVSDALGARVYATASRRTQLRTQNGAYHRWAQDSKRIHFGLGTARRVNLRVEWPSGATEIYSDVAADRLYRITEDQGIAPVNLGQGQALPCGMPSYNQRSEITMVIWKDCVTERWQMRALAGDGNTTYRGVLSTSAAPALLKAYSLEPTDKLDSDPAPTKVVFTFNVSKGTVDGLDLKLAPNSSACLDLTANGATAQIVLGHHRAPMNAPFDLRTGGACQN